MLGFKHLFPGFFPISFIIGKNYDIFLISGYRLVLTSLFYVESLKSIFLWVSKIHLCELWGEKAVALLKPSFDAHQPRGLLPPPRSV